MSLQYQNENFGGTLEFRSQPHGAWEIGAHLHEFSEILYCHRGEGTVVVNGRAFTLSAGEFVWIPPNYIHEYHFGDVRIVCAVFSNDLIPLFFKALGGRQLFVAPIEAGELSGVLNEIYRYKSEDYLEVSGHLSLIAARVLERSRLEEVRALDGVLYQKVISYLSEHYTEDITLKGVAKAFGYNEKYLSHSLHTLTGIHFKQLLSSYRISHARRLLEREKEISITRVATESGFPATNTFHRVFKKITGVTPMEYKQRFIK